jgi:CHAT domain-containing protein/tetratricopeptide (TPR) repeat protein
MCEQYYRRILAGSFGLVLAAAALANGWALPARHQGRSDVSAQSEQPVALKVGVPVEREMKGGEIHKYTLTLAAGQLLHVVIDQQGIDVVAALFGPDGKLIVEVDSPNGTEGPEPVWAVAEASGNYRIDVRSLDEHATAGRYVVKLEEVRPATTRDRSLVAARRDSAEAALLLTQGTTETLQKSIEKYKEALSLYRSAGDRGGMKETLLFLAQAYSFLGEKQGALIYAKEALLLAREEKDRSTEAIILINLGSVYYDLGEPREALSFLEEALPIFRAIGSKRGEAVTFSNIGAVYQVLGDRQMALDSFERAQLIYREIGDRNDEASTLNNIGNVYSSLGEQQKALDLFMQALKFHRASGSRQGEATALSNIGAVYSSLGEKDKALSYYEQALPIQRAVGDKVGEATTLNNIGRIYYDMGERQKALDYYESALSLTRAVGNPPGVMAILNNIAAAYDGLGDKRKALEYYNQALVIARQLGSRDNEARTLNSIGAVYNSQGEPRKALDYYSQALGIARDIHDGNTEADILLAIGTARESLGDLAGALDNYLQGIDIRERLRSNLDSENPRLSFDESSAEFYWRAALVDVSLGRADLAFSLGEKMRARSLLDRLKKTQTPRSNGNPPQAGDPDRNAAGGNNTLTVSEVQRLLQPDTTLLSYLVTPRKTIAFLLTKDSFRTVELPVQESELFNLIRQFRGFVSLKTWQQDKLRLLYQYLVSPLKPYLKTPVVGIVPHGVLHYLPFSMLSDGQRYFDEEHTIFYLPSASVLPYVLRNRKGDSSLLAVAYSPPEGRDHLPYANSEVKDISNIYGARMMLTGSEATEGRVRSVMGDYGIVHVAAHYEVNTEDPLRSYIALAPDKSEGGFLEIKEVYDLRLVKTDMVVLSASQTQLGKQTGSDDIIALDRAFLYAGAATVVGSLWDVDDEAKSLLMRLFYKNLKQGVGKAAALRKAQAETRIKYPHPYYWAGFVLTGDPGK